MTLFRNCDGRSLPLLLLLLIPSAAYGYLDPATGSLVIQVVVGGLLAGAATIKIYWKKLRGIFVRQTSQD